SNGRPAASKGSKRGGEGSGKAPKSYVVQNGDTLTSIAHRMGISVARIQELNPGVDPQILVSGEKLKLR
ncbi:MAG TPA: LysM domain-containing protein, partial [Solirubrobacterales bacterium]|nr:LysM domain-containing protein [Solirubrobacterales bacterium]